MHGEEAFLGKTAHVPFRVMPRVVDVEPRCIFPRKSPIVAHFACGPIRRSIRHKQREKHYGKSYRRLARKKGLGVEGVAPHFEAACELEGGGFIGHRGAGFC